jgi:uncharacterized membrane protein YraQ (UPF0718 family)
VTPDNAWVYAILPFLTMAVLTVGFIVVFRQRAKTRRELGARRTSRTVVPRPWWLRPWVWLVTVLVAALLGVSVWPGFFALALVVVPVAWRGRPRRTPRVDPRTNGHGHRDGGAFTRE